MKMHEEIILTLSLPLIATSEMPHFSNAEHIVVTYLDPLKIEANVCVGLHNLLLRYVEQKLHHYMCVRIDSDLKKNVLTYTQFCIHAADPTSKCPIHTISRYFFELLEFKFFLFRL